MKTATLFAAATGLVASVSAGPAHQHERFHKRDMDWSSTADPATTSTTSSSTGWGDWSFDPTTTTTSTSTGWGDWSTEAAATTTSTSTSTGWSDWSADPTTTSTSTGWGDWSTEAAATTTSTSTSTGWSDWSADPTTSTSTGWPTTTADSWAYPFGDPAACGVDPVSDWGTTTTIQSTTYTTVTVSPTSWADWSDPTTTSTSTGWANWSESTTASAVSTSTSTGWPDWGTSVSSSAPAASSTTAASGGKAPISPAKNQWAMTYTPYTSQGGCKDAGSVLADLTIIKGKGFTAVRIYSTDCSGLVNVGTAASSLGLKIIVGVFINSSGISGAQAQVEEIVAWGQWDLVELIVVGNEAISNGYCDAGSLAAFVTGSKGKFTGAGYTGPVTTTEPLNIWQASGSTLCSAVDVVGGNMHAFFNADTTADQAGSFIASELAALAEVCGGGKPVYNLESGWPHAGQANGAAVPGVSEQAAAINSIEATCGAQVVFFSFEDDLWKAPGEFGVEQSWGCVDVFSGSSGW